jgi:hypothetical protein
VNQRLEALAPFLHFESEPYLGTARVGRHEGYRQDQHQYWLLDGFTNSRSYPYSDPNPQGLRYFRNPVKAVVDAHDGRLWLYVSDPSDPVLRTWRRAFPELFRPLSEMPEALLRHIRVPQSQFTIQSERLLRYHVTDVRTFYNGDDVWSVPYEIYGNSNVQVRPYHLTLQLPGQTSTEFVLLLPFAPLKRTNLVVANAVAVGKEPLDALTTKLSAKLGAPELQQRLFTVLWDNLQNVGELGSLVQVKEGVEMVLADWVDAQAKRKGLGKVIATNTLPLLEMAGMADDIYQQEAKQLVLQRQALEMQAQAIQQELLTAIEAVAGAEASDPSERLFAEDTARGLKLLQTLARQFDVVVMNPPYGSFVDRERVRKFVDTTYPLTKNNIYAAFIDRATQLVENEGYVGALVSSTFVNLKTFEKLRTEILLKRNPLLVMLDLGYGILDDATVEAAALVLKGGTT